MIVFGKIKLFEYEIMSLQNELSCAKMAYSDMVKKNVPLSTTVRDLKGSLIEAQKKDNAFSFDYGALKAYYSQLLKEHESVNQYLAKKTNEASKAQEEVDLLVKNFTKVMKLFGFSYRVGEEKE